MSATPTPRRSRSTTTRSPRAQHRRGSGEDLRGHRRQPRPGAVDGALRLLSIEILDPKVDRRICSALETAAVAAVNLALQKAALPAGDAVAALDRKPGGSAA